MCVKKDMTLYIMVSLLIDVIIKQHVSVIFLLQYEWILDRSVKHAVRWLNCFRCCNWFVRIHRACCVV